MSSFILRFEMPLNIIKRHIPLCLSQQEVLAIIIAERYGHGDLAAATRLLLARVLASESST